MTSHITVEVGGQVDPPLTKDCLQKTRLIKVKMFPNYTVWIKIRNVDLVWTKGVLKTIRWLLGMKQWKNIVHKCIKKSPLHICFPLNYVKYYRTDFLKNTWNAASDLGEYLKTLSPIIAFPEYIGIFSIWSNLKNLLKTKYYLGKILPWKIYNSYYISIHG